MCFCMSALFAVPENVAFNLLDRFFFWGGGVSIFDADGQSAWAFKNRYRLNSQREASFVFNLFHLFYLSVG